VALIRCRECGNEVSTEAQSCPHCGAVIKRKKSCLGCAGVAFLILIIFGVVCSLVEKGTWSPPTSSRSGESPTSSQPRLYKEGETVSIGYTSYAVWKSWYSARLSDNKLLDHKPDARFLFVDLTVRNNDKEPRYIPSFKLIDENGAEYETTSKAWAVEGSIGVLESLNPSVQKQGVIVFDVPTDHKYRLEAFGGFWSGQHALIELSPKQGR
jgi:hypothetical protein